MASQLLGRQYAELPNANFVFAVIERYCIDKSQRLTRSTETSQFSQVTRLAGSYSFIFMYLAVPCQLSFTSDQNARGHACLFSGGTRLQIQ